MDKLRSVETIQDLLNGELLKRKKKNPQFSMRAMAKLIGISSGQLSKLMQGKKKLTTSIALKTAENLGLTEEQTESLLGLVHPELALKRKQLKPSKRIVLSEKDVLALSDWYHLGILSLCRLKDNQGTPQWISNQLGIDEKTAQEALDRLIDLRLVWIEKGKLMRSEAPLTSSEEVPSEALRVAHKKNLELAIKKIDSVPVEDRSFTYITTAIDPKKLKQAKQMIMEFRDHLSMELNGPNPTEVFTLGIQLFPLTNNELKNQTDNPRNEL